LQNNNNSALRIFIGIAVALFLVGMLFLFLYLQSRAKQMDNPQLPSQADMSNHVPSHVPPHVPSSGFIPANISLPDTHLLPPSEEFRDPFYAFVIGIAENDSLGRWTKQHLETYLAQHEQKSKLPLEYFHSLERHTADTTKSELRRGVKVERTWHLTLKEPLDYPMPYSILGYNLGSLSIARVLTFSEWRLGNRNVHAPSEDEISVIPVTDLMVFRLDSGWIVLDADGWVDKLLGGKLDDCWTEGFAICRQDGEIRGLALSQNRKSRTLCGEIDFATNEITPKGGPFARGVAVFIRPWLAPPEGAPSRTWNFDD